MPFSDVLNKINFELDKFDVVEEKEAPVRTARKIVEKNYTELAEKAVLVAKLKEKKELSEKEKTFIAAVEAIVLTDQERMKVRESITKLFKTVSTKK
jgi:hypothetical protein